MTRGHRKSSLQKRRGVPSVWLMTDERVSMTDLLRAVARLPRGAAVIVRHYGLAAEARHDLFGQVRAAARRRGVRVLLAGDARLARAWGADGHHGHGPAPVDRPAWLQSAPVHDRRELAHAQRAGADAVLVSPLFRTRSHPGAPALGAFLFAALARSARVPVIALGGVHPRHAGLVRQLGAEGYAAIDGLVPRARRG